MLSLNDFLVCMAPLTRHWPEPTTEQWGDYYSLLKHHEPEVLMAAALKVMGSHVYPTFPKPAVILEACVSVLAPVGRSGAESWGDVKRAAIRYGHDRPPDGIVWTFKDPLTLEAVTALGWAYICQSEDEMVIRAHYIKMYEQIRDRAQAATRELPAVRDARQALTTRREEMLRLTASIGAAK